MISEITSIEEIINQGGTGRHETFTPRYGWLKKGYEAAKDPGAFKAKDSIERLGVGKNMVSSIRFWCQAFKLIDVDHNAMVTRTDFGNDLLNDKGWDPFLEDIASLWLLHWQLFIPRLEAVSWPLAFNKGNTHLSFDIKLLNKVIFNSAQKYPRLAALSENTFERDASCIIRMYAEATDENSSEIECPFNQLGLLRRTDEAHWVYFDINDKPSLPPLILAAACFSYMNAYLPPGQRTISLQRLSYDFNSPGIAFKLPESSIGDKLMSASKLMDKFSLVNVMGSMQLHLEEEPKTLCALAIKKYYGEK